MPSPSRPPRTHRTIATTATAVTVGVTAAVAGVLCGVAPAQATTPAGAHPSAASVVGGGAYVPVTPRRSMDTRTGLGLGRVAKVGPGQTVTVPLAGRAGIPGAGAASAVVVNLTETNNTAGSYLTAYPAGLPQRPGTSSLSFAGRSTQSNLVTVPLSADGKVAIYNAAGSTDVVVDVVGYYATDVSTTYGGLQTLPPSRVFDSRDAGVAFQDGDGVDIALDFTTSGNPNANDQVRAFVVNLSAANPTSGGYFKAWATGQTPATTPSLTFRPGVDGGSLAIIERGDSASLPSMTFDASVGGGSANLLIDLVGVFTAPGASADARFTPLETPIRVVDTRSTTSPNLAAAQTRELSAPTLGGPTTTALAANLTIVGPTAPTYVTVYPGDLTTRPTVSSINAGRGTIVANGAILGLSSPRTTPDLKAYNAVGTTPFVIDVTGTFQSAPGVAAARAPQWSKARVEATRTR
ncbi:hypothetical protein V3N99_06740 [Dermatophilaceae bacterium Soc4.6]